MDNISYIVIELSGDLCLSVCKVSIYSCIMWSRRYVLALRHALQFWTATCLFLSLIVLGTRPTTHQPQLLTQLLIILNNLPLSSPP